jgi:hypothetical protein
MHWKIFGRNVTCAKTDPQGCQMVCFQTKNPYLGKFWRTLDWKMLAYCIAICIIFGDLGYCMTMGYILYSFRTFFRFWYHVPRKVWQPCRSSSVTTLRSESESKAESDHQARKSLSLATGYISIQTNHLEKFSWPTSGATLSPCRDPVEKPPWLEKAFAINSFETYLSPKNFSFNCQKM